MLKWYVLDFDYNTGCMKPYNIISSALLDDIKKKRKSGKITDYETLKESLKREFMYHFWSKAECEFIASDLSGKKEQKVDMWEQIKPNLDLITKCIAEELKFRFKGKSNKIEEVD